MNTDDKDIEETIKKTLSEAESTVKAVWEIDGTTVYIRNITCDNNQISVDWFTFDNSLDKVVLGDKVETLAFNLIKEKQQCSSTLFSQTWSSIKNIFGLRGRT